ncbi:MAG: hypothetical protein ONB46_03365 [candidate division KSB1 bacterium]|nr:hypothetical protein [candidate division KSB1 bacterium]MDZ7365039.1 hypothetical protein [candidate division KSB1 bacterium]MDZ7403434.1 hypothetical protein [candidate division KSB1 bacterium]
MAEGVATYTARSTPKPRAAARTIAGLAADDEVWAFVKANDLWPHLQTAILLVRETFFDVREMKLSYEPDPELPFFNSVVINVKSKGTVEKVFEQEQNYTRAFVEAISFEKRHQIGLLVSIAQ